MGRSTPARRAPQEVHGGLRALLATLFLCHAVVALPISGAAAADQQFRDWRKSCPIVNGKPNCVAYTQSGGETRIGPVAVRISIGLRDGREHVVVLDMSAPVVQERRFGISVDGKTPMIATFAQCDQIACRSIVTGEAANALVSQFKSGREAMVVYFAGERVPVRARISLQGFTAAYNSLPKVVG